MSGKPQAIGDFTVFRPFQILGDIGKFGVFIGGRRHFYLSGASGSKWGTRAKQFRGFW